MGNKIARTTQVSASEYYLHDLPSSYNLVLKEVLGRGRFFKSILCKHDEGLVLVKVYFKRGDYIDLREYERRLFHIKEIFRGLEFPHVWPFQVQFLSFRLIGFWMVFVLFVCLVAEKIREISENFGGFFFVSLLRSTQLESNWVVY